MLSIESMMVRCLAQWKIWTINWTISSTTISWIMAISANNASAKKVCILLEKSHKFSFTSNSKPKCRRTSVSQNSQFKEQFGNQNLSDIPDEILPHLKLKNMNRLIGHLSINSLRNNIDTLKLLFKTSFGGIYDV